MEKIRGILILGYLVCALWALIAILKGFGVL